MTPKEILLASAELLAKPGGFGKGTFARAIDGIPVNANDPAAVCFCSYGAIKHVLGLNNGESWPAEGRKAIACLRAQIPTREDWSDKIIRFNDDPKQTAKKLVAKFRKAAKECTS